MAPRTVVIAGAGQAGLWCAKELRSLGFDGRITMIGEEAYPPYDRPPLSKAVLVGSATPESTYYLSLAELAVQEIDFVAGTRVASIVCAGRSVAVDGGADIRYDHLVLATGGQVRRISLPGSEGVDILYLRGIDDCLALQSAIAPGRRVVVLGGGLIGLEVAAAASKLGAKATVVEAAPRVMARIVGPEVSQFFEGLHRANGVEILTGRMPTRIRAGSVPHAIDFADGTSIEGEVIVAGIGIVPNEAIARAAGLATGNGIWTDAFCRTSNPDISAVGDVANQLNAGLGRRVRQETWQNAKTQGACAARNICGRTEAYAVTPWGWSDQFSTNLQMLGLPETLEGGILRGEPSGGSFSVFYLKDGRIDGMVAVNAVRDVAASRRLVADRVQVDPRVLADAATPMMSLLRPASATRPQSG